LTTEEYTLYTKKEEKKEKNIALKWIEW